MNQRKKASPAGSAPAKAKAARTQPGTQTGVGLVMERLSFYDDMKAKSWKVAAVGVASLAISISMSFFVLTKKENNVYFAINNDGSIVELTPLFSPNVSDATVANWFTRALVDTFDFNYYNLKHRMNESAIKWFTPEGRRELIRTMDENGNFEVIADRKMIVSLDTSNTPIVIQSGRPSWSNSYLWKLQVPAKITYRTETSVYSNNVIVTAVVSRRSLLEDPAGLGISSIIITVDNK